jgi:hypothetical protein
MQMKVLGVERRRRWSCDEKVRLIEETLHNQRKDTAPQLISGVRLLNLAPFGFVKKISHCHIQRDREAAQGV